MPTRVNYKRRKEKERRLAKLLLIAAAVLLRWEGGGRGGLGNHYGRNATISARPAWEIRDAVPTTSQITSSAAQATASTIDAVRVLEHV